jgi:hypothetical protein
MQGYLYPAAFDVTYAGSISSMAVACSVVRQQNVPLGPRGDTCKVAFSVIAPPGLITKRLIDARLAQA